MATLYVDARNGNDTASGTTWAAAWKTLGHAVASGANGSTINCTGVFNESLSLGSGNRTYYFVAVGYAIMDGTSSLTNGISCTAGAQYSTFTGFEVHHYTSYGFNHAVENAIMQFTNCIFRDCLWGASLGYSGGGGEYVNFNNCLFLNNTQYGVKTTNFGHWTFTGCTFTGSSIGAYMTYQNGGWQIFTKCVFSNNTAHLYLGLWYAGVYQGTTNDIDFSTGYCYDSVHGNKTTLATWQAAVLTDYSSISAVPGYLDAAKGLFRLGKTSAAVISGQILGAYNTKLGYVISNNVNTTLWTGATVSPASGAVLDGSNNWTLASGTSATVTFETADFLTAKHVRKINLSQVYAGLGGGVGGGPSAIVDYDATGTLPETWTYRLAVSSDGSTYGAWTEYNIGADVNQTNVRRLKIEVTLRNDA